jgi:hypothetical protein
LSVEAESLLLEIKKAEKERHCCKHGNENVVNMAGKFLMAVDLFSQNFVVNADISHNTNLLLQKMVITNLP